MGARNATGLSSRSQKPGLTTCGLQGTLARMSHHHAQVVQVRLTRWEWDVFERIAQTKRTTIENALRDQLRLGPFDAEPRPESQERHLRVVSPSRSLFDRAH
jgi:hypothetical protein